MKTIVRAAPDTLRRPLLVTAVLAASLVLGACDSTDAPLAPDLPPTSPARAKGLPANGPIYFGAGYVTQARWWKLGLLASIASLLVWMTLGPLWWKLLGVW